MHPHVVGAKIFDDLEIKKLSTNYMWVHAFPAPNLAYGQPGMLAHLPSSKLTADKRSFEPTYKAAVILASSTLTAVLTQDALQI